MEKNTPNTALLIMDMQAAMLQSLPGAAALAGNVAKAIANARARQIPVIYVILYFRPGAPEINMNNKSFAASKERFAAMDMEMFTKIEPAVAPMQGEIIVTKRRFSAFTGSDLEVILRTHSVQHLVLAGYSTSGVVLSTLREAADKDYRLTVLADCCADTDEEIHRVLTTKVFTRQAEVLTAAEWIVKATH